MKEISDTLIPIKESTGLEIDIYSAGGNLLFSTSLEKPSYSYRHPSSADFKNGIIMDKNADVTYFAVNCAQSLIGVITGSNDVSRNYAVMVSTLIEKTLFKGKDSLDKETGLKMLFEGTLSKKQYEILKNDYSGIFHNSYVLKICINPREKLERLVSFLNAVSSHSDLIIKMDEESVVYIKKADENAYDSVNDFVCILYENIKEEIKAAIKISVSGGAQNFGELENAYNECVFAFKYGSVFDKNSDIYSAKQYTLIKMLSNLPKESLKGLYDLKLFDKNGAKILEDKDLTETAQEFMKNSLNVAQTSRALYMHRNTLNYKLDKIEKATGLDIRRFDDALIFKVIIILYKLQDNF